MKRKKYYAALQRDETDWWIVTFPDLPGCVTQGKTIEQAQNRSREALAVFLDVEEEDLKIEFKINLPVAVRRLVEKASEANIEAESAQKRASKAKRKAAHTLTSRGFSARDIGTLLGVSRQRAHMLTLPSSRS